MKKRIIAALIVASTVSLIGCKSTTETDAQKTLSSSEIDARIEKAIEDNNKSLEDEILAKVDKQIKKELTNVGSLTSKEKEELSNSIMASVRQEISNNINTQNTAGTTVVKQPVTENVYKTTQISNTYTTTDDTSATSPADQPPKIKDGTVIPVTNTLPYIFTKDIYTFTIDNISVTAYNHESEPYREPIYPYELRISLSGSYTKAPSNVDIYWTKFGTITLEPYGSEFSLTGFSRDTDAQTCSLDTILTVNVIPEKVTFFCDKN